MKKICVALGIIWLILGLASPAEAGKVYLISGADSVQDNAVKTALEGFGHQVTIGVAHWSFDGTQDLSSYDVVIFLDSNSYDIADMPEAGQISLLNFIQAGGGLITGEWVYYEVYVNYYFSVLSVALPAIYTNYDAASPITYTAATPDAALNFQVTSPFTFNVTDYDGTESVLLARPGATMYYSSSNGGAGLLGWTYGAGRVLSFCTPIGQAELDNPNYRQLLNNAVNWRPVPPAIKNDVYVISGGEPHQDSAIMLVLTSSGRRVTLGPPAYLFNGLPNLTDYKVVIFLDSNFSAPPDMPEAGQTALLNFIKSGRGLITGEWVLYYAGGGSRYQILAPAFAGSSNGNRDSSSSLTYSVQFPDPVLNQGLPPAFTFPATDFGGTQSDLVAKPGAKTFYSSSILHAGLVGWQYQRGRVLNFSTCIGTDELADTNYRRLFRNAVRWTTSHFSMGAIELLLLD